MPPLRKDLDFIPLEHENQQFILVRDPLGLVREGQALPLPLFRLLAQLPPGGSLSDMQALLAEQSGAQPPAMEQMREMVRELDEAFLLESESFIQAREQVMREFVASSSRPAVMAGQAYPADLETLGTWLDSTLLGTAAPGEEARPLKALVAPHIDPGIGATAYAKAYGALQGSAPERVVILGVGHQLGDALFSCCDKEFQTPFGPLACDRTTVQALKNFREPGAPSESVPGLMARDDFVHRNEHSIEFQLVFLQHVLRHNRFDITPLLCGSLLYSLPEYSRQAFLDTAGPLLEVLRQAVASPESKTLLVAGVDFSHIGPKFGHDKPARELENETRAHDRALLERLCAQDAEGFWEESARVRDRYNVCGFSALATLLEILPPCQGEELGYELWHEEPTASAVSFAAAAFREQE